jgi:hypothetical protein
MTVGAGSGGILEDMSDLPLTGDILGIRLGTVDGDPGIRPSYHQRVETAAVWEPIPDDGLPRHEGPAPGARE